MRCGYPEEAGEVMLVRYFAKLEAVAALFSRPFSTSWWI